MLNRNDVLSLLDSIFNFIDSGVIECNGKVFRGHPGFYFFHSKRELEDKINLVLNKDIYDVYDIYYIVNYLIKFMVGKYDSHTKISFMNHKYIPIIFDIIDGNVYISHVTSDKEDYLYDRVISINGISIDRVLSEIEDICSYSTYSYLQVFEEGFLSDYDALRSIPSISSSCNSFVFGLGSGKDISFVYGEDGVIDYSYRENLSYYIIDNNIVINYNSCRDKDKMISLIDELSRIDSGSYNYIIDIRGNGGGDSSVIKPLISYLENRNIVVLCDERVFSSGRMALIELKKIGAYVIGTDISTSINAFGNVPGEYVIEDMGLVVKRSSSYWHYDNCFNLSGFDKSNFSSYFNDKRELLEPIILHPDKMISVSIDDIINNRDVFLEEATDYINSKKKYNI